MAKVNLTNIGTLTPPASAVTALNDNVAEIARAMDTMLSRDGQGPNQMEAELDMNSQKILNVADPEAESDAVNLETMRSSIAGAIFGDVSLTVLGDATIRTDLANEAAGYGAALLAWIQTGTGATKQWVLDELRRTIRPEHFGADPTGAALSDAAFATCAARGEAITLTPGATYYLSVGLTPVSGTSFVCDGWCTIKLKTGTGGFNVTDQTGTRTDTDRCVISLVGKDNIELDGIIFEPDSTKEVVIYPVRVAGGFNSPSKGFRVGRLLFRNFKMGVMLSINSIGAGGYDIDWLWAEDCGTASGTAYWTGGNGQITVFEMDNDLVAATHSAPGRVRFVGGRNILLTGQALTDYGQQTDLINVAGISSGTDRKGPTILSYYADGIGEVVDVFGSHCVIKGGRARNVYGDVVKLVHGAAYNDIEIESVESWGRSVVGLFGSSTATTDCKGNNIRVGSVKGGGTYGLAGDSTVVLFGGGTTSLAKNNMIEVGVVDCGASMEYIVQDGTADADNANVVRVGKVIGAPVTRFTSAPPDNVTATFPGNATRTRMTVGAAQTITATTATVQFNTAAIDRQAETDVANYRVRCKTPGRKLVQAQLRIGGANSGDTITVRIKQNSGAAANIAQAVQSQGNGTDEHTFNISQVVTIGEDIAGTSAADLWIEATHSGTGTPVTVMNTTSMSYFEVVDLSA